MTFLTYLFILVFGMQNKNGLCKGLFHGEVRKSFAHENHEGGMPEKFYLIDEKEVQMMLKECEIAYQRHIEIVFSDTSVCIVII